MGLDFYYSVISPPCRSVRFLAAHMGLELNLKLMNLMQDQEHLKAEFVALNPQHCIPTLVDGDFVLWESRAILEYLAAKYGKGKYLPTDPKKRALVSQRLQFDMGTLTQRSADYYHEMWFKKAAGNPDKLKKIEEAYSFLDIFLEKSEWVAGDELTVADFALGVTVSQNVNLDFDISPYKNVTRWFERVKKLPGYEINEEGAGAFKELISKFLA